MEHKRKSTSQNEKQLPKNVVEIFELLRYEILLLHTKREIYRELYDSGAEVRNLLNFAAPVFFVIQRDMLVNDILITMRRLIDGEEFKGNGRKNLSLDYLISCIDDSETKVEIKKLVREAKRKADFARTISNKRIAHNDLLTKQKVEKLPDFDMETIDEALLSVAHVMNMISSYWNRPPEKYQMAGIGTGNELVNRMKQARAHCDLLSASLELMLKESKDN